MFRYSESESDGTESIDNEELMDGWDWDREIEELMSEDWETDDNVDEKKVEYEGDNGGEINEALGAPPPLCYPVVSIDM